MCDIVRYKVYGHDAWQGDDELRLSGRSTAIRCLSRPYIHYDRPALHKIGIRSRPYTNLVYGAGPTQIGIRSRPYTTLQMEPALHKLVYGAGPTQLCKWSRPYIRTLREHQIYIGCHMESVSVQGSDFCLDSC